MTRKQTLTPLPWKVVHHKNGEGFGGKLGNTFTGYNLIGNDATEDLHATLIMNTDNKKDAAFIVRACNAHDELVSCLEMALSAVDELSGKSGLDGWTALGKKTRAALAKAKR